MLSLNNGRAIQTINAVWTSSHTKKNGIADVALENREEYPILHGRTECLKYRKQLFRVPRS